MWATWITFGVYPSDPKGNERATAKASSYTQNEFTSVDLTDPFGSVLETFRRLDQIPIPTRTITTFELSDAAGVNTFNDHTHSRNWLQGWGA
jgi:hypothetical protein